MALKFKLVMRKNLGEDHESIPEKVYAQMVSWDFSAFVSDRRGYRMRRRFQRT